MPRLPTATATGAPAGASSGKDARAANVAARTSAIGGALGRVAEIRWRDGSGTGGRLFESMRNIVLNLKGENTSHETGRKNAHLLPAGLPVAGPLGNFVGQCTELLERSARHALLSQS